MVPDEGLENVDPISGDEPDVPTDDKQDDEPVTPCTGAWITVDEVVAFHGLKPQHLNLEKDDTSKMEAIVCKWIRQCEDLINKYTHRAYTSETVPLAVQNVCLRLTSNMVSLAIQKRDNPIIKVNDWTIQALGSDIFTDDLKGDLEPFVNDASTDPNKVGVYAITGEGLWCR